MWRSISDQFMPAYNVVAPDLIGYGTAPAWAGSAALSLRDETQRAAAAIPCCERRVHLVGYSYGGAVALEFALANPVRIESLVLVEPVFFAALRYAGNDQDLERFRQLRRAFNQALDSGNVEEARRDFVDFWAGAAALRGLADRTLIVRGDRSPPPMQALVDGLHGLMPGSTHAVIRGANHLSPLTHAAQLAALLASHLHAAYERSLR